MDINNARRPKRRRTQGPVTETPETMLRNRQYTPEARRFQWIQSEILSPKRDAVVNETRLDIQDTAALTQQVKDFAKELGADVVGRAATQRGSDPKSSP